MAVMMVRITTNVSDKSSQISQFANGCTIWPMQVGVAVVDGPVAVGPVVVVGVGASPTYKVEAEVL